MALYQRLSPARSEGERGNSPKGRDSKQQKTKYQLLLASEVPSWYAHNSFLHTGYRPINGSVKLCIDSLQFMHNETVNIYSHLIPAVIALASNGILYQYFREYYPAASLMDQLAIHLYLTTSVMCFGISSIYHTLLCHSEPYSDLLGRLDYSGIILETFGSFVSGIYVTFYCEPGLQKLYWGMVSFLFSLSWASINTLINGDNVDWRAGVPIHRYPREPSVPEPSVEDVSTLYLRCNWPLGTVAHHPRRLHLSICPMEQAGRRGILSARGPGTHYWGGFLCGK